MTDCQRWSEGRHAWRHTSEGGFNPQLFEVAEIATDAQPRAFVEQHHYAHTYSAAIRRYGLFEGPWMVGAAILGAPARAQVLTNVFPTLRPYRESLELSRFVLLDRVPANAESWFWARCRELLGRAGVRGVVTFSDPLARSTVDGATVLPGHVGTIYQASNGAYLGRGRGGTLYLLPDGSVLNRRSLSKLRNGEVGQAGVERQLVKFGAPPRDAGEPGVEYADRALLAVKVRTLKHPGCFRYAWRIGADRRELAFALPEIRPYPKRGVN